MSEKLIQRGAEANIILVKDSNKVFIIKDRVKKSYRLKVLDEKLRKQRTRAETKLLEKASNIINTPKPFLDSAKDFKIKMPFIDGKKLSKHLDLFPLEKQKSICSFIGKNIAKLHDIDIIHGDLTTSNMIYVEDKKLNRKEIVNDKKINKINSHSRGFTNKNILGVGGRGGFKIYFIDFGLGFISKKIEDKAVDLHLLKQALEAKHFENWETLFGEVLKGYSTSKNHKLVLEQLKKVEKRGRYKEQY